MHLRLCQVMRTYWVYIMASRSLTLYTGITGDLCRRALQHKSGEIEGFTKLYNINRLVYYEMFEHIGNAIAREKQVKSWTRAKRLALIKSMNPTWQDLAEGWGEKAELQIPRFARDDKPSEKSKPPCLKSKAVGSSDATSVPNKSKTA